MQRLKFSGAVGLMYRSLGVKRLNWPTKSHWEGDSFLASQEISSISQNPKVHNCIKKSLPLVSHLTRMSPFHALALFL